MRLPFLLIALLLTTATSIAEDSKLAVLTCLKSYRDAIVAGDTAKAVALTATFPKLPAKQVLEDTQEHVDQAKARNLKIWIYSSSVRVVENCAVVVISDHEKPAPDDAAYLIRQDGHWKVLPGLANWNRDYMEHGESERLAFAQLQEIYEESRKLMRSEKTAKPE